MVRQASRDPLRLNSEGPRRDERDTTLPEIAVDAAIADKSASTFGGDCRPHAPITAMLPHREGARVAQADPPRIVSGRVPAHFPQTTGRQRERLRWRSGARPQACRGNAKYTGYSGPVPHVVTLASTANRRRTYSTSFTPHRPRSENSSRKKRNRLGSVHPPPPSPRVLPPGSGK